MGRSQGVRAQGLKLSGVLAALGVAACAEILGGHFGQYSHEGDGASPVDAGESAGGETTAGSGGRGLVGAGGRVIGSGGTLFGSGGSASGGRIGSGGGPSCFSGEKLCGGVCTPPNPSIGCGLGACMPCPSPPANGYSVCGGAQCDFDCHVGHVRNTLGNGCDPRTGTGGAPGTGGTGPACAPGQKDCGLGCVVPNPGIGCGPTGCSGCPAPPSNGYSVCANDQCGFECYVGFDCNAAGDGCDPSGAGGSGGGGGTGGAGTCQASQCPSCGPLLGQPCCVSGRCGCPTLPFIPTTCAAN